MPAGTRAKPKATGHCPQCDKETKHQYRPFCSKRCADLDLYNWLQGNYTIPTEEEDSQVPEDAMRH
ncbi:MAG: DNA gyrase inhibitor YacG [Rhizobiales bacterium]|nr:DNA gyrase inhibitor YacG [Hyphomicrobiales bacterium]